MRKLTAFALACSLSGCGSYLRDRPTHPAPIAPVQRRLEAGADDGSSTREAERSDDHAPPVDAGHAFGFFGNPELVALIDEAVAQHRDVLAGIAAVRQARAIADQSRAARFPTASLLVTGSLGRSISPGLGSVDARSIAVTIPISYEVDLFGRYAREHSATRAEAEASAEDLAALALSVAAEVAEAWFDRVEILLRKRALEAQLDVQRRLLVIIEDRAAHGLVPNVDALSQAQLVASTESSLTLVPAEDAVQMHRIALLLGREPSATIPEPPAALPSIAEVSATSFGADRIAQRPDLRAAWLRLEAADDRVGAAVRAQLPSLRLSVTPGYQALHSESTLRNASAQGITYALAGTITVPLFDGLRAHAVAVERRGRAEELLRDYERLLLGALVETENALVLERQAREQAAVLERLHDLARRTREATEAAYTAGLTDYTRVLLALRDEVAAELSMIAARRAVLSYRVQLYRALGGDFAL